MHDKEKQDEREDEIKEIEETRRSMECKTKKTEKKGILCGDIGRNESTSI